MTDDDAVPTPVKIMDLVFLRGLGYVLVLFGSISLILLGMHIWELYQQPELAIGYVEFLRATADAEAIPLTLLKFAAWPILILVLLLVAKVSVMAIESGHLLVSRNTGVARR